MLKVPNYNVIVPTVPTIRLTTFRRTTDDGNRLARVFDFTANETTLIQLPWMPTSPHWVEIYIDGIRLINPTTTNTVSGREYEVFNVLGNLIRFNTPVTGQLKIICDTQGAHWQRSLIIGADNVQAFFETENLYDLVTENWPIEAGFAQGTSYRVQIKPGPLFQIGSNVVIKNCEPKRFNGRFQVTRATEDTVYFNGPAVAREYIKTKGTVSGFGNLTINVTKGIGLYSEPVVITQPYHGYVRLSTDRRSMSYTPNKNYAGNDTFSWSLINQHGQIGEPRCCNITVTI